jgi:hypothetical protein
MGGPIIEVPFNESSVFTWITMGPENEPEKANFCFY